LRKITLAILLIIALATTELAFICSPYFGLAQTSTTVSGLIAQSTTWTKTNSPYTLTGPVGIPSGVTLTIEPGVIVNLVSYYLVINGSLVAKGVNNEKIQINGANGSPPTTSLGSSIAISFSYGITINGDGSIIENAVINSVRIALVGSSVINNCTITGYTSLGQSSIVSNSLVKGIIVASGVSQVSNSNIDGGIQAEGGSPIISNNIISNGELDGAGIEFILTDEIEIVGNTISGYSNGISAGGNGKIENNLITNNVNGIAVSGKVTIQGNTLQKNNVALSIGGNMPSTVTNNNFENNTYNIYLLTSINNDAVNNWWGTTDIQAISSTIFDSKNDFNLGTVTFVPFLTAPNPEAPVLLISSPTPTSTVSVSPSQMPTATPNQSGSKNEVFFGLDWAEIAIIALLGIITVLLATAVMFMYNRSVKAKSKT